MSKTLQIQFQNRTLILYDSLKQMLTKEKYRIKKREPKILTKLNVQQIEQETNEKFTSENITTYNICTAAPNKQQLLYKGEIQSFYTNLKRKRIGLMKLRTKQ